MAPKKTTKKETKSKTTEKKTKKAKKSEIVLTFSPILSAADQFVALLREKVVKENYGKEEVTYVPAIEGLPMKLIVKKGETISVTEDQFRKLQERGHAETDEEYKKREDFIYNLSSQHPETLTWDMIVSEGANFATLHESQMIIYNDKLIRV